MSEPKLYSLDALKAMGGGNPEFVKKMCEIFLAIAPDGVVKIKEGWANGDLRMVFQHAHKIKSNINHLSVDSLKPVILDIERMARENQAEPAVMSSLIEILETTMTEVEKQIKEDIL